MINVRVVLTAILAIVLCLSGTVCAACPSADLSGDCRVDLDDFALLADQWLSVYDFSDLDAMTLQWLTAGTPQPDITWISVSEDGFTGQMSKYETTNAQYCQFLNDALVTGDITVSGNIVYGAGGSNIGQDFAGINYYNLTGPGYTYNGATNGGAARIGWTGSSFTVDAGFENHPVTHISWYGSAAFADYYGWRLPTEWEWQAVADFDGTFTYGCGTTINNTKANYAGSTHPYGTTPVGHFGAFGHGLSDMSGNSFEWTSSVGTSGSGYCTVRGGSWQYNVSNCAVTYRYNYAQNYTNYHIGFRVCR